MMRPVSLLLIALVLAAGSAATADPLSNGTKEERQACAPEAVKFCKQELDANASDTAAVLKCLQRNREKISQKCQDVLKNHGQ
jgi:Cysteine rich repeat